MTDPDLMSDVTEALDTQSRRIAELQRELAEVRARLEQVKKHCEGKLIPDKQLASHGDYDHGEHYLAADILHLLETVVERRDSISDRLSKLSDEDFAKAIGDDGPSGYTGSPSSGFKSRG